MAIANPTNTDPAQGEIAVATSAVKVLSSCATRRGVVIINSGDGNITLGKSGVTFGTVGLLAKGDAVVFDDYTQELYAISNSSATLVIFSW